MACQYLTFGIFCFLASPLVTRFGSRAMLRLGTACLAYHPARIRGIDCTSRRTSSRCLAKSWITMTAYATATWTDISSYSRPSSAASASPYHCAKSLFPIAHLGGPGRLHPRVLQRRECLLSPEHIFHDVLLQRSDGEHPGSTDAAEHGHTAGPVHRHDLLRDQCHRCTILYILLQHH